MSRKLGRDLNKGLALRNKSRYDRHAEIGPEETEAILELADKLVTILGEEPDEGAF